MQPEKQCVSPESSLSSCSFAFQVYKLSCTAVHVSATKMQNKVTLQLQSSACKHISELQEASSIILIVSYTSCLHAGTNYFGSHFYLGNCKFNSPSPEVFLFGENSDLNYLGTHPVTVTITTHHQDCVYGFFLVQFPYKPDRKLRATTTLRSLINVQKDSVKIVKLVCICAHRFHHISGSINNYMFKVAINEIAIMQGSLLRKSFV